MMKTLGSRANSSSSAILRASRTVIYACEKGNFQRTMCLSLEWMAKERAWGSIEREEGEKRTNVLRITGTKVFAQSILCQLRE